MFSNKVSSKFDINAVIRENMAENYDDYELDDVEFIYDTDIMKDEEDFSELKGNGFNDSLGNGVFPESLIQKTIFLK